MFFVVEHLEPKLSEWLWIEYSHAVQIIGRERVIITNVKKRGEFRKLTKLARVERERVCELFKQHELVVLDPRARRKLSPPDLLDKKAIVIGGILGEDPPLGRTRKLLTKSLPRALARNLGESQFAIDGTAYVAKQVLEGHPLERIPVRLGLEIRWSKDHSTLLPYAFPLVGSKPFIASELISYLKRKSWP